MRALLAQPRTIKATAIRQMDHLSFIRALVCPSVIHKRRSGKSVDMGKLSIEKRWRIVHLKAERRSCASIAKKVRCSKKAVYFWLARYQETGDVADKQITGRPVALCTEARRRAIELLNDKEVGTAKAVARKLKAEGRCDRVLSDSTVLRCAKQQAVLDGDPICCLRGRPAQRLTDDTKKKRLAFAKKHQGATFRKWMFTDRVKFPFRYPGDKVQRVRWVRQSNKHEAGAFKADHPQVFNVYAGLTAYGVTKMHAVTGTTGLKTDFQTVKGTSSKNITIAEYKHVGSDTLLPEGKRLFGQKGQTSWFLQQDGDPTHKSIKPLVQEFSQTSGNQVTLIEDWPPHSPDLSPIENVWGWVDAEVQKKGCKTFAEFKQAVLDTFKSVPIGMCERLIDSVPKRLQRVQQRNGGKCGY